MARHIALFGGMFDPVHCGHVAVINALSGRDDIDELWVIPAAMSPHKETSFLSNEQRLSLLETALEKRSKITVRLLELERAIPSYTIDTVKECCLMYPNDTFSLVIGSDQFFKFHTWKDVDILLEKVRILVFNRESYIQKDSYDTYIDTVLPQAKGRIDFLEFPIVSVSSSLVRGYLESNTSIRGLVPRSVYRMLLAYGHIESFHHVIGISGRAGSGKSMAQSILNKAMDFLHIDLDVLGHNSLKESSVKEQLSSYFGSGILDEAGAVSRPALGKRVFSNSVELQKLNSIVHPVIKQNVIELLSKASKKTILIEGALIQEIGLFDLCDTYLVIDAADEDIISHAEKDIAPILKSQRTRDQYKEAADFIIVNMFDTTFKLDVESFFNKGTKGAS